MTSNYSFLPGYDIATFVLCQLVGTTSNYLGAGRKDTGERRVIFSYFQCVFSFCSCLQKDSKFQQCSSSQFPTSQAAAWIPPVHLLTSLQFLNEFDGHPTWLPRFQQYSLRVVSYWVSGKSSQCPRWFSKKFKTAPTTDSLLVNFISSPADCSLSASLDPSTMNQICPQATTAPSQRSLNPRVGEHSSLPSLFLIWMFSLSSRVLFFKVLFYFLLVNSL